MSASKLVKLFYCCSDSLQDEQMRQKLENHLKDLERQRVITKWHKGMISPGIEWEAAIDTELSTADIILVLISSDFIASDYHWNVVIKQAMQQHRDGKSRVIPILLRPVLDTWKVTLNNLTVLPKGPKGEKPVTDWYLYDSAFANIAQGIKEVAEEITDPTYHLKKNSRQASAVLIIFVKAVTSAIVYLVSLTASYLLQPSKKRRHRRVRKMPIRAIILVSLFGGFIYPLLEKLNIRESGNIPSEINSALDSSQKGKVSTTGWIWLGIVENRPGSLSARKPLVIQEKNIEEYPSIHPPVIPPPGSIVTLRQIVNLRKEKSLDSEPIHQLQEGEKLVILQVKPLAKPGSSSPYIQLMAQVRQCIHNCDK